MRLGRYLLGPEAIELPRDREEASKTSLIEAPYAQFSTGSLIGATAASWGLVLLFSSPVKVVIN